MKTLFIALSIALAACGVADPAFAQGWPNRTIRIVVPYAPGGGVSVLAQIVGNKLSELIKQPVVIDNRPGAGGNVGSDVVAKSAPDGYTILLHTSAHASAGPLYKSLPFDPIKDFVPVTMVIATQTIVCGSFKHPATTLRELIAQAKAKPGSMNYASSGPGSSLHLFAELLKTSAGIDLLHIPYRGDAPMITAMIAGDVHLAFLPQSTGLAAIQGNQVRALAVTGRKRMAQLPNVPTVGEEGVAGFEEGSWNEHVRAGRHAARHRAGDPAGHGQGARRSAGARTAACGRAGAGRQRAGRVRRAVQGRHRALRQDHRAGQDPEAGLGSKRSRQPTAAHPQTEAEVQTARSPCHTSRGNFNLGQRHGSTGALVDLDVARIGVGDPGDIICLWQRGPITAAAGVALLATVFAAVHHAEVVAHRVGEPFGTLVLAPGRHGDRDGIDCFSHGRGTD